MAFYCDPLGWSKLPLAILLIGLAATPTWSEEPSGSGASLRTHPIRLFQPRAILQHLSPLVSSNRMILNESARELVVFADPKTQQAVAEQIREIESTAILFDRIAVEAGDPEEWQSRIQRAIRTEIAGNRPRLLTVRPFKFELDRDRQGVLVWGLASQIDRVSELLHGQQAAPVARRRAEPDATTSDRRSQSPIPDQRSLTPPIDQEFVRVPKGPVRIVLVKELGLIMIRASGGTERGLPVPSGNVRIDD